MIIAIISIIKGEIKDFTIGNKEDKIVEIKEDTKIMGVSLIAIKKEGTSIKGREIIKKNNKKIKL